MEIRPLPESVNALISEKEWQVEDCKKEIEEAQKNINGCLSKHENYQATFLPMYVKNLVAAVNRMRVLNDDINRLKYILRMDELSRENAQEATK